MIPTVSKELKDIVERFQQQFPNQVADITFNQTIAIIIKLYKNIHQSRSDVSEEEAVRIIRRAFFSKLNFGKLSKDL